MYIKSINSLSKSIRIILEIVEAAGRKKNEGPFATEINNIMEKIEREMESTEGRVKLIILNENHVSKLTKFTFHRCGQRQREGGESEHMQRSERKARSRVEKEILL